MEAENYVEINRKIGELKKRILLAEGQKTANSAEWTKQNRINSETISTLKKEIKELTVKMGRLRNPLQRPVVIKESKEVPSNPTQSKMTATTAIIVGKVNYPIGAKNVEDAIFLTDMKLTENRKQLDLLRHRFKTKQQRLQKLMEQYRELVANKEHLNQNLGERPPETLEEQANRKLVVQLENEIHRTNVQWMEAEHIRKKYRSIESSLMNDSERFERSLRELEESLAEQRTEINRLQEIHNEAIEMRDAAKIVLQRQEQQANISQKVRERQAMDFRKQVEQRKLELERIGRRLFLEGKTLAHQDSIASSSAVQLTGKTETDETPNAQLENVTSGMEALFKHLMEVTGATSPREVLERFRSQKESAVRLQYLRNTAETEKTLLENTREKLSKELEAAKFSDVKESEVNQEVVEQIKNKISDLKVQRDRDLEAAENTTEILKHIKDHLSEMIYRLQEVDEGDIALKTRNIIIRVNNLPSFLANEAADEDFIELLKLKLNHCQDLYQRQRQLDGLAIEIPKLDLLEEGVEEDEAALYAQEKPKPQLPGPEEGKPPPMPMCYYNLLAGRAQRAAGTISSSPEQAPTAAAPTDEESEVPSRNYIKRQSVLIVDSKSRRKPFRPTAGPTTRRK